MLIQAPTGAGKTIMFSKLIAESGLKCLVLAHRGELIRQARDKLAQSTGLECAVFSAYLKEKKIDHVTVASVQSLANFKGELDFDIVIIDEAHRVPRKEKESQYGKVLEKIKGRKIGFTATPYRLDSGEIYGEDEWWPELNYQIPLRQLIDEGHLCDYVHRVSAGTARITAAKAKLKTTAGEYNERDASLMMVKMENLHSVVNTVQDEKAIVVFCVSIAHAEALAEIIGECSIVHSKMKADIRDQHLIDFDEGKTRWMLNVGVLTEGWDCSRVDCIVLARPTKSTALYVQMVGRGLRLHDGKNACIIYDLVGCHEEFGFVDNPTINIDEQERGEACKTKVCDECFAVVESSCRECPMCGHVLVEEIEYEIGSEDEEHEMHEVSIEDHPDYGDVTFGSAEEYESAAGNKCIRVSYKHTARPRAVTHYYPIGPRWVGTKLAGIVKKGRPSFKERWLSTERFMKAVNGQHIFPLTGLMVKKDGDYEKISTL